MLIGRALFVKRVAGSVLLLLSSLCLASSPAVDNALPHYNPHAVKVPDTAHYVLPDKSIRIMGADHFDFILDGFDHLFVQTHPGFRFVHDLQGTSTGIPALMFDLTPFAPMGRAMLTRLEGGPYEKIVGQPPIAIRIAHTSTTSLKLASSLAIYVNKANPIEKLTMQQVSQIFTTGSPHGDFTRWGQLGLGKDWSNRIIHPYGTPEYTGFGGYLEDVHFAGRPYNPAYEMYPNTESILARLAADPAGIAFAATGRLTPDLKIVAIADQPHGFYSKGEDADVAAGKYALGRYVYLYVRRLPGQPVDPFVKEYLRLVLSHEGQQIIASQPDGYIPLSAQEAAAELSKLD